MKIQQLIGIGCLSMIIIGCSTAHSYCRTSSSSCESNCEVIDNCECADPACSYRTGFAGNCLDGVQCCRSFGNIGDSNFYTSYGSDGYQNESYEMAEGYFYNEVNGDVNPPRSSTSSKAQTTTTRTVVKSYKMENFKGQ